MNNSGKPDGEQSRRCTNLVALEVSVLRRIVNAAHETLVMSGKYARLWVVLTVLIVVTSAYCANVKNLSFLEKNPELKARLLKWEQEAPEEVKSNIEKLRRFPQPRSTGTLPYPGFRFLSLHGLQMLPALLDASERTVDKGAILALIEANDDETVWNVTRVQQFSSLLSKTGTSVTLSELACKALASIGDPALEPLAVALTDKRSDIRRHAARALGEIAKQKRFEARRVGYKAYKSALDNGRDKTFAASEYERNEQEVLREITYAIEPLIGALKDEDSSVRKVAAKSLAEIPDKRRVKALIDALKDEDASVRKAAAKSLGEIPDKRRVKALIDAIKDEDPSVRETAARALWGIRDGRVTEVLITCLRDKSASVRSAAASVLSITANKDMVVPLITLLNDKDWFVRKFKPRYRTWEVIQADNFARSEAARLLGSIRDERAIDSLIAAMKDKSSTICISAVEALKQITGEDYGEDYDRWLQWWQEKKENGK